MTFEKPRSKAMIYVDIRHSGPGRNLSAVTCRQTVVGVAARIGAGVDSNVKEAHYRAAMDIQMTTQFYFWWLDKSGCQMKHF